MATLNIWHGWDGLNIWLFELAQQVRSPALEPALVLVSVFASFWLAPYYGRVIGAQALHIVRCPDRHTILGCRLESRWGGRLLPLSARNGSCRSARMGAQDRV